MPIPSKKNIPAAGVPVGTTAKTQERTPAANKASSYKQSAKQEISYESPQQLPLTKKNFIWMAVAGAMIVIGFLLMLGAGTTTEAFNADIFSTRRTVIGPTIAFLGFVAMGVAIIIRPKSAAEDDSISE